MSLMFINFVNSVDSFSFLPLYTYIPVMILLLPCSWKKLQITNWFVACRRFKSIASGDIMQSTLVVLPLPGQNSHSFRIHLLVLENNIRLRKCSCWNFFLVQTSRRCQLFYFISLISWWFIILVGKILKDIKPSMVL